MAVDCVVVAAVVGVTFCAKDVLCHVAHVAGAAGTALGVAESVDAVAQHSRVTAAHGGSHRLRALRAIVFLPGVMTIFHSMAANW